MIDGIEKKDIKNLLALARIKVTEAEEDKLLTDVQGILGYIGEIQTATVPDGVVDERELVNVMREDTNAHEAGVYTDQILAEAPKTEDGYLVVKKIL
jgi:aspartyl-tRNA(Asn)/glutamyl-tRNA(Gln) amidotransferase subunit C